MAKAKEKAKVMTAEEKAAKRKARMEALKNRPAGQRTNSKQIDVIETEKGTVETYGYAVVAKRKHIGILTTVVAKDKDGNIISTSQAWIPGDLTIKAKKGHGGITAPKAKGEKEEEEEAVEEKKDNKKKKAAKKND